MGHEIHAKDVFGEVRARGERAWHGLGIALAPGMETWPAFEEIGLGWETELCPVNAQVGEQSVELPEHRAHVRCDTNDVLGVVSSSYKPITNREMAEFADALVEADDSVEVETAGSLRNGRRVFALVRLPKSIEVTDQDVLENYVLVNNSHDGSMAFSVFPTSVRVVCANTLRIAESTRGHKGISFRHEGNIKQKIEQARLALGLITNSVERYEAQVRLLAAKHVAKEDVREYFRACYDKTFGVTPEPAEDDEAAKERYQRQMEKRDGTLRRWEELLDHENQDIEGIRGTAWAAYNAVTQWHDHERGRYQSVMDSDARVHSNLFGASDAAKQAALNEALELV